MRYRTWSKRTLKPSQSHDVESSGMVKVTTDVWVWPQFYFSTAEKRAMYPLFAYGLRDVARLCGVPLAVLVTDLKKKRIDPWNLESVFRYCYTRMQSGKYQRRWDSVVPPKKDAPTKAYFKFREDRKVTLTRMSFKRRTRETIKVSLPAID